MDELNCTHDCSTCGASCEDGGEQREKDFFTQMEDLSKALHGDEGFDVLEKVVAELEAEDA